MSNLVHSKMSRWAVMNIVVGLSLFAVALTMLLNNNESYYNSLQTELITTKNNVGSDSWDIINKRAKDRHKRNFYDNGLFDKIVKTFLSERDDYISRNIEESDDMQARFVDNIQVMSYQVFFRLTVLEYWITALAPFCIAIMVSGYYKWRIKKYQLGGSSTGKGRLWLKVAWMLSIGFIVMLIVPPFIVSLSIYTPVVFFLVASLAVSNYIASFAKEF
jgi:hypothetical protein